MDYGPVADRHVVADAGAWINGNILAQGYLCTEVRFRKHAQRRMSFRVKKGQQFGKAQVGIGNLNRIAAVALAARHHQYGPGPGVRNLGRVFRVGQKGDLIRAGVFQRRQAIYCKILVTLYGSAQIIRQFFQCSGGGHNYFFLLLLNNFNTSSVRSVLSSTNSMLSFLTKMKV